MHCISQTDPSWYGFDCASKGKANNSTHAATSAEAILLILVSLFLQWKWRGSEWTEHVRTAHASSDYASFEDFELFAIDHFQKRRGNLSLDAIRWDEKVDPRSRMALS
jgi:hypothetical protein